MRNGGPFVSEPRRYRWYVLTALVAVYMLMHLDRQVISLLVEPLRAEFGLSDGQVGLLAGTAYALAFALTGIPLGRLVDRVHRVRLLAALLSLWSALTALSSLAGNFATLVALRVGIGAAESGSSPTCMSLLSDFFESRRRSTAIGLFMMGPQLGTIVGFVVAGAVAADYGWRAALLVAGLPGLLLAVVLLATVREPPRGAMDAGAAGRHAPRAERPPLRGVLREIGRVPALVHTIIGITLANMVAAGITVWLPALLMRNYGVGIQAAGISVGLGIATFAAAASAVSGVLTDRLNARGAAGSMRVVTVAALVGMPCIWVGALSGSYALTIGAFAVQNVAHMFLNTPAYSLALSSVSPAARGTTTALLQVTSNLVGYGVGPQAVGLLSDALRGLAGADSLRWAIVAFAGCLAWAAAHFAIAARRLRTAPRS